MKYAVEMGSGVMIYRPSAIKLTSGDTQTHRRNGDLINPVSFLA
jgi:hypothetical protein